MSELEENAAIGVIQDGRRRSSDDQILPPHAEPEVLEDIVPEEAGPDEQPARGVEDDLGPVRVSDGMTKSLPLIYYSGDGVNFFLRMGVIGG